MKQLTLFLLLALFIISCGDDDTPVTPEKPQSQSLLPLADGNKWYFESKSYNGDKLLQNENFYLTLASQGEYYFEEAPVTLYALYYVYDENLTDPYEAGKGFKYNNYLYGTVSRDIEVRTIKKASIGMLLEVDEEGERYIGDTFFEIKKINYELDGKTYQAWQFTSKKTIGYRVIEVYIPGIGMAYRLWEDTSEGTSTEDKLIKYELN